MAIIGRNTVNLYRPVGPSNSPGVERVDGHIQILAKPVIGNQSKKVSEILVSILKILMTIGTYREDSGAYAPDQQQQLETRRNKKRDAWVRWRSRNTLGHWTESRSRKAELSLAG